MKRPEIKNEFIKHLAENGITNTSSLLLKDAVAQLLTFFKEKSVDGCDPLVPETDKVFICIETQANAVVVISVGRQCIIDNDLSLDDIKSGEDYAVNSLCIDFEFKTIPPKSPISGRYIWCDSKDQIEEFIEEINSDAEYRAYSEKPALRVEIMYTGDSI